MDTKGYQMKFEDFFRVIDRNKYYVFSYEDILMLFPDEKRDNLKKTTYRWKNKGWIYVLKKGLYEITYPKDINIPDLYIANRLYGPSYVSMETALSIYSIIPEVSMAVTSVTTKPTCEFKNKHGLFIYRTVKPVSFTGYYVQKQWDFNVLLAEPEKALVDFIYLKTYRAQKINFEEERISKKIVSNLNKNKLNKYAEQYNLDLKDFYAFL